MFNNDTYIYRDPRLRGLHQRIVNSKFYASYDDESVSAYDLTGSDTIYCLAIFLKDTDEVRIVLYSINPSMDRTTIRMMLQNMTAGARTYNMQHSQELTAEQNQVSRTVVRRIATNDYEFGLPIRQLKIRDTSLSDRIRNTIRQLNVDTWYTIDDKIYLQLNDKKLRLTIQQPRNVLIQSLPQLNDVWYTDSEITSPDDAQYLEEILIRSRNDTLAHYNHQDYQIIRGRLLLTLIPTDLTVLPIIRANLDLVFQLLIANTDLRLSGLQHYLSTGEVIQLSSEAFEVLTALRQQRDHLDSLFGPLTADEALQLLSDEWAVEVVV